MLRKTTYNRKCLLLAGVALLFLVLAYNVSFKQTFEIRADIKEKEKKLSWLKEKEKEIPVLKHKIGLVEKIHNAGDSGSVRDKLIAFISDYAENNNCIVTEIPVLGSYKKESVKIETNGFTIRGGFHSLLRLQDELEKNFKLLAKVMSVRFFSVKDIQSKKTNLYMNIITQSFSRSNAIKNEK